MQPLSSSQILSSLADEVTARSRDSAFAGFSSAIDDYFDYFSYLANTSYISQKDNQFGLLLGGYDSINYDLREWLKSIDKIFQTVTRLLEFDSIYFTMAADELRSAISALERSPKYSVIYFVQHAYICAFDRLVEWHSKKPSAHSEPKSNINQFLANNHYDAVKSIIDNWEGIYFSEQALYGIRHSKYNDDDAWQIIKNIFPTIFSNLLNSAYFIAASTWQEDQISASEFRDHLIRWPSKRVVDFDVELQLRYTDVSLDMAKDSWTQTKNLINKSDNRQIHNLTPGGVAASILYTSWKDTILLLASIFIGWKMDDKKNSALLTSIFRSIINREHSKSIHTFSHRNPFSFDETAISLFRILSSVNPGYRSYIDETIRKIDRVSEHRILNGYVYRPTTRDNILHIHEQFAVLMLVVSQEVPNIVSNPIKRYILEIKSQPNYESEIAENLLYHITSIRRQLEQPNRSEIFIRTASSLRETPITPHDIESLISFFIDAEKMVK